MKYLILSILILTIASCSSSDKSDTKANKGETYSTLAEEDEGSENKNSEDLGLTTLSFDRMEYDFGKVKEDTDNPAVFKVTNTGKNPLVIEKVSTSCGCTTAKKPEKPLAPGETDEIEVVFHPKEGQLNDQSKSVTIKANTEPLMTVLKIKAFVEKK
ncbi:MAG: hypothetical protein CL824_05760 [Crocinitomicaceae bacterium]|nr:hypothetical protein [Crocinitomicaceae bacterium]|tara:strand:+ start:89 stop:559 length:471 start_codon:yes stop_codon:yes gene_type:complete